ncbi:aminotransferase class III-fold pyridoxal phosphate-dependent enzyme [Nonomuraea rubra]|uniref:aminotransferase class III-fold pyridoxal phosphate-dependent enzyme n=1 Tax=Nonomuraea rubra TaxID=46180 RepID=UPI00361F6004
MEPRWSSSKALWERACRSIGGGVASSVRGGVYPHQLYFESGKGAHLVDIDGDRYIDYVLGWGPLLLGHGHPAILEAAHAQLDRGIMFGGGNMHEVVAAERFLGALGWAERLLWTNTGTEAVQIALRLARAHTGRDIVVKLGGGYHGWHDTVLASYMGYGKGESLFRTRWDSQPPRWRTCVSASTTTWTTARRPSRPSPGGSPPFWSIRPRRTPVASPPSPVTWRACDGCATNTARC